MTLHFKICGVCEPRHVDIAVAAGADMIGLVFFDRSPRYLDPEQAAHIALAARGRAATVGLFVDPAEDLLASVIRHIPLTHIQLHGSETPERVAGIRQRYGLPVIKAIGVTDPADIDAGTAYTGHADMLLFDTKAAPEAALPGGNGRAFDWRALAQVTGDTPWLLAGGLSPDTVHDAIHAVRHLPGFAGVDVSSGVEAERGRKDPDLIRQFLTNAGAAAINPDPKDA